MYYDYIFIDRLCVFQRYLRGIAILEDDNMVHKGLSEIRLFGQPWQLAWLPFSRTKSKTMIDDSKIDR